MSYEIETTEAVGFQCRHIFTDGRRCASPTLRSPAGHEPFCYYHHTTRGAASMTHREPAPPGSSSRRATFTLPNPGDLSERSGIQLAIGEVLRRIASDEIDPRRAGLLLYGLQIASLNLKRDRQNNEDTASSEPVTEITVDPDHGLLAPPAELHANQPIGSAQRLLMELGDPGEYDDVTAARQPNPARGSTPQLELLEPEASQTTGPGNLTIDIQASALASHETTHRSRNFIPRPEHHRCSPCGLPRMGKSPGTMCGKSAAKKQKAHLSVGFSK
jgi:hypothetical protein